MVCSPIRWYFDLTVHLWFSSHEFPVVLVNVRVNKYFPGRAFLSFLLSVLESSTDWSAFGFVVGLVLQAGVNNGAELALLNFENVVMLWNRPTLLVLTISLILFARVFIIEVITIVFVSRKNKACAQLPASEPNLCIILSIQHRVLLRATVSKGSFVLQGLVLGSLHVATRVLSAAYRFQNAMHNFNTINEPSTSPMRQVTSQSGASFKFSLQF